MDEERKPPLVPTDSTPGSPPAPPASPWAKPTMWIAIVFLIVAALVYVFESFRQWPGEMAGKTSAALASAGKQLLDVVSAFNQNVVTTSFISYATSIDAHQYLQFATLRQTEVFSQKDEATTGFGYIPLPDVLVEARAPVEYNYYVDLNAKWQFLLKENQIHVLAPRIQFNKPAVDASAIEYEVRRGSIFRNSDQAKENLKKSISVVAHQRARENVPLVRETARKQIAEYVEKWLAKSFTDGAQFPVKVYFPGENLPETIEFSNRPLD